MTSSNYYRAVIAFASGVLVATVFSMAWPTLVWLMGGAVVCVLLWRRDIQAEGATIWLKAGIILAFFVLGGVRLELTMQSFGHSKLAMVVGQTVTLLGVVTREPDERESTKHLYVQAGPDLVLVSTDRYVPVSYGDVVTVEGKLSLPESFTTDLGRTFNYPGYLLARGIEYRISFATVVVESSGAGNPIVAPLLKFKSSFRRKIEALIPEPAAGLGEGLLLGVNQALGEELELAFRKTGIIHIVVLSGYNVMLVVFFVLFVLGYFLPPRPRLLVGILAIVAFALLVGLSATVLRASIMASLLLLAQAFGRTYLVLRGLLLAGLVMLLFNPLLLVYDVGFQLSFLATLGLILIAPHLERWVIRVPNFAGMRTFIVATVATQIAVWPLLLYQVGELSVVSVIVNVLVLPMVPVAMLLTFITGLVAFLSTPLASLLALPTYLSLQYINQLALWFADLTFSAVTIPVFPFYFVPLAYIVIGVVVWRLYQSAQILGYGDLAEQWLRPNNKIKSLPLSEAEIKTWVIEEEIDEQSKNKRTRQISE